MLNRHAIVLTLGLGVVFVLVGAPEVGLSWMGPGLLGALVGLLLDDGLSPRRVMLGHLFQLYGGAIRNRFENFSRSKSWNRKNDCVGSDRFLIADGDAPALFLFVTA